MGHHLGLCGLSCGLEHMPNTKFAGEVLFFCLCFRFKASSFCRLDGQEGSCKQAACKRSRQAAEGMLQLWFDVMLSEIPALHIATLPTLHISLLPPPSCWYSCCSSQAPLTKIGIPVVILKIRICIWRALYCLQVFLFKLGSVFGQQI